MNPTVISNDLKNETCAPEPGPKACSFLVMRAEGWQCAKGSLFEEMLRERRAAGTIRSMGDNCSGPPNFTHNPGALRPQHGGEG